MSEIEAIRGEYTQGVCFDGAAILCDGRMITIEDIISRLRSTNDLLDHIDKLEKSLRDVIEDLEMRADIDGKGQRVLNCSNWVLVEAREALNK